MIQSLSRDHGITLQHKEYAPIEKTFVDRRSIRVNSERKHMIKYEKLGIVKKGSINVHLPFSPLNPFPQFRLYSSSFFLTVKSPICRKRKQLGNKGTAG